MTGVQLARRRWTRTIIAGSAALVLALLGVLAGSNGAVSSTLYGNFDADGNISLRFADGTPIGTTSLPGTLVPAGTYTIIVNNNSLDDLGSPHQFRLTGPGVTLNSTDIQVTFTATFQASSTYVYSDVFVPSERRFFGTAGSGATLTNANQGTTATTTSSPTKTTTTSTGKATTTTSESAIGTKIDLGPILGTVRATVSKGGGISLLTSGKPFGKLISGRYKFIVSDESTKAGFVLQELDHNAKTITAVPFVGKHTVIVTLQVGRWFYYPSITGTKRYFTVVASR